MTLYLGKKAVCPTKIVKKEVAKVKYGASIDNIIGDVDANGIPNFGELFTFVGTGIIELSGDYKFASRFYATKWDGAYFPDLVRIGNGRAALSGQGCCTDSFAYNQTYDNSVVDMPKLETINGTYVATSMFAAGKVSEINLPKLTSINGTQAAARMFGTCRIKNVNLPSLTTISGVSAALGMFSGSYVETVELPALATVTGSTACNTMFSKNDKLARVDFPSLTQIDSTSFGSSTTSNIFYQCTGLLEIHFRADMQATIEAMSQYANKWGATNATIYFDL